MSPLLAISNLNLRLAEQTIAFSGSGENGEMLFFLIDEGHNSVSVQYANKIDKCIIAKIVV
jgi:hypothetical protein